MTHKQLRREQQLELKRREASELLSQAVDSLTQATNEIIDNLRGINGKFITQSINDGK